MKPSTRWYCLGAVLLTCSLLPQSATAADWMFAPSYFTHPSSPGYNPETAPHSRSAYRRPYLSQYPRISLRGGWRVNSYSLQNGNSYDRTYYREFFLDAR